jgi:hypothetical protein
LLVAIIKKIPISFSSFSIQANALNIKLQVAILDELTKKA